MTFRNVFVLCTGRSGSTTFTRAASHSTNYTAGHESRTHLIGETRLDYPPNHIEVDNRLSWFLGRLEARFGDEAYYVHLRRDPDETAASWAVRRHPGSMMNAYGWGILSQSPRADQWLEAATDYVNTVTANIEAFLANKSHRAVVHLETAQNDFSAVWEQIGSEGDLDAALAEWSRRYNARPTTQPPAPAAHPVPQHVARKLARAVVGLPRYLRNA